MPGSEERWQAFRKREREAKFLHPDSDESTYTAPKLSAPVHRHTAAHSHHAAALAPKHHRAKIFDDHHLDQAPIEPGTSRLDQL